MVKIFVNFTDFHNFTTQYPWTVAENAHVQLLGNLVREMNSSCPCKRKGFLAQIDGVWSGMGQHLDNAQKSSIKTALNSSEIQFQSNGNTFFTF